MTVFKQLQLLLVRWGLSQTVACIRTAQAERNKRLRSSPFWGR